MSQKKIQTFFARRYDANTPSISSTNIENESAASVPVELNTPSSSKTVETAASENLDVFASETEIESDDNSIHQHPAKRKKQSNVRKYDEDYLAFGFIEKVVSETSRPLCLLCDVLLANSSLFPSKLERHIKRNHPDVAKKPIEYFKELKSQHKSQGKALASFTQTELVGIESSFIIAYEIAKAKKAFRLDK